MKRIALTIEYLGSGYHGWQRQENGMSIQQKLEEALQRLTHEQIVITGASRTDAGVHALGQVAHFNSDSSIPPHKFCFALNTMLPPDIRVVESKEVSPDFHARFQAIQKTYHYRILNRAHASALLHQTHAHVSLPLDASKMQEAAKLFLGEHDFSAFMATGGHAKTFTRTMYAAEVIKNGDEVLFSITGNGFLYNMVRIMAGTLIEIGHDKLPSACINEAFQTKSRLGLGPTAPACGLALVKIDYPDEEIPL